MPLQQGMNQQSPAVVNTIIRGKATTDTSNGRTFTRRRKRRAKNASVKRARRSGGRKLKFGSPAWRKKYMKRR